MKRLITFALMATCLVISCSKFDDSAIWDKLNDHENRIAYLEEVCKKMNNDIVNLQTLVTALETNDYIVNASPLAAGDGYTFIFKSGKSVVIYNGKDGKDGTDGKDGIDGKDGVTPTISVMKDVDGVYYWTINGEWLLGNGQKGKASATDGKNGQNGTDGTNGTNGKDGISPKFKIEDEYWYISYDNGNSWEKLGKATGDNGLDGINGDNIFSKVTQDEKYVYFYLMNGSMITLLKHDPVNIQFEDLAVKAICCKNWDVDKNGELSYEEASKVVNLSGFSNKTNIIAFTELKYFTSLNNIPTNCFYGCQQLWKIVLPESITSIENGAFQNCENLEFISIPESVTTIGQSAFKGCSSLLEVNIPSNVTHLPQSLFDGCKMLNNIELHDNIISIGGGVFRYCKFTEITIPKSVESIGSEAFYQCTSLKYIYIKATTPPTLPISSNAFATGSSVTIYVPNSALSKYRSAWSQQYGKSVQGYDFPE